MAKKRHKVLEDRIRKLAGKCRSSCESVSAETAKAVLRLESEFRSSGLDRVLAVVHRQMPVHAAVPDLTYDYLQGLHSLYSGRNVFDEMSMDGDVNKTSVTPIFRVFGDYRDAVRGDMDSILKFHMKIDDVYDELVMLTDVNIVSDGDGDHVRVYVPADGMLLRSDVYLDGRDCVVDRIAVGKSDDAVMEGVLADSRDCGVSVYLAENPSGMVVGEDVMAYAVAELCGYGKDDGFASFVMGMNSDDYSEGSAVDDADDEDWSSFGFPVRDPKTSYLN